MTDVSKLEQRVQTLKNRNTRVVLRFDDVSQKTVLLIDAICYLQEPGPKVVKIDAPAGQGDGQLLELLRGLLIEGRLPGDA